LPENRSSPEPPFSRLYPILDAALETEESLASSIEALARAGCRLVQLRVKELPDAAFHRWAKTASRAARDAGIRLVINDRVDVALLVGADGVHLGQDDLSPESARKALGDGAILGLSTHDVAQARRADAEPIDYVAIGPVFETTTKTSSHRALGAEGVAEVRAVVAKPLVAIGGITLERAEPLYQAGVDGVAVISALKIPGRSLESVAREWLAAGPGGPLY
jgi:thiamine-phosphate pyrophosphorylase